MVGDGLDDEINASLVRIVNAGRTARMSELSILESTLRITVGTLRDAARTPNTPRARTEVLALVAQDLEDTLDTVCTQLEKTRS